MASCPYPRFTLRVPIIPTSWILEPEIPESKGPTRTRNNIHLGSSEALDGIASKSLVWHVMSDDWTNALSLAKGLGAAGK
jgi:hypothetical protein